MKLLLPTNDLEGVLTMNWGSPLSAEGLWSGCFVCVNFGLTAWERLTWSLILHLKPTRNTLYRRPHRNFPHLHLHLRANYRGTPLRDCFHVPADVPYRTPLQHADGLPEYVPKYAEVVPYSAVLLPELAASVFDDSGDFKAFQVVTIAAAMPMQRNQIDRALNSTFSKTATVPCCSILPPIYSNVCPCSWTSCGVCRRQSGARCTSNGWVPD